MEGQISFYGVERAIIQNVSTPIITYYAKCAPSVCENIDKEHWRFLWGGTAEKKCMTMVKWDKVPSPKNKEGRGLWKAKHIVQLGLSKLNWRVGQEKGNIWAKILRQKYLYQDGPSGFGRVNLKNKMGKSENP